MIKLDLPQFRTGSFERAPSVARAVGYFEDAYLQWSHGGKPAFLLRYFIVVEATHKLKARAVGRGGRGLCAPARLGALSMATRSPNGGNDFAFFACCALPPSDERFSTDDAWLKGVGTLKGMTEVLL